MEYVNQNESLSNIQLARNTARKCHKDYKISFPVPIQELLTDKYGFTILEIELDESISALVDIDSKYIGINNAHHSNRQRFTLAHELGHYCLKHKENRYNEIDNTPGSKAPFEKEADEFAAELLMPQQELKRVKTMEIKDMLEHFQVSKQALFNQLMKYKLI